MTSNIENHDALIRGLNEGDLDRASAGTSGFMHAVGAAAYKGLLEANAMTDSTFSAADWAACQARGYCN